MATHARPQPADPYNPTQSEPVRHPSPFVPIRLPVFTPVVFLNDALIRVHRYTVQYSLDLHSGQL